MNAALFVETRLISNLSSVINAHLDKLPADYELIIYHGRHNKHLFNGFDCEKNETIVNSLRDYNSFMTNPHLWVRLQNYERVLVFQNDSMLLRKGIEEFYKWDYIGAPWKFQQNGGNGGLSLRNPKAMLKTINEVPYSPDLGYEDVYFCNHLNGKLAPREECEKFSCETIFKLGTLGYHAIDNYLSYEQQEAIKTQYRRLASV